MKFRSKRTFKAILKATFEAIFGAIFRRYPFEATHEAFEAKKEFTVRVRLVKVIGE